VLKIITLIIGKTLNL